MPLKAKLSFSEKVEVDLEGLAVVQVAQVPVTVMELLRPLHTVRVDPTLKAAVEAAADHQKVDSAALTVFSREFACKRFFKNFLEN